MQSCVAVVECVLLVVCFSFAIFMFVRCIGRCIVCSVISVMLESKMIPRITDSIRLENVDTVCAIFVS